MRIGVVGCGYWGAKHVRVLHGIRGVDGVVLIEPNDAAREALTSVFPGVAHVAEIGDALDSIDAVIVATPPLTHFDIALQAIRAGKHVLVEKPLSVNVAQSEQLVAEAVKAGVRLMVGHTFEYNAAVLRLREAVRTAELGKLHYIDSVRLNLGPIRRDVNVIADLAPHDISIANFVLGALPDAVTAWASAHTHQRIEDTATLRLDYTSLGVSATIRVSWLDPCKVRRTTVVGDRMMAVYNDLDDNERLKFYDRGIAEDDHGANHEAPMSYRYGSITAPYLHYREPLLVEDEDFVGAVLEDRSPRASGEHGLAVVRIVDAAQAAVRAQCTAPIDWSRSPGVKESAETIIDITDPLATPAS
jgi:predicted dehydrogenase